MPDRSLEPSVWGEVPEGAYVPSQRLKALDADGVDYSVLYPGIAGIGGEGFGGIKDSELELACSRAYNDWLIDEWAACSKRFVPQCIVPISSVDAAVAEIKRAVKRGHKGIIFPAIPEHLRETPHLNEQYYDPIWRTCQEMLIPVCFHAGSLEKLELPPDEKLSPRLAGAFEAIARPFSLTHAVANLIVSRILERFPKLKVVFADSSLGWITFILEAVDYEFEQAGVRRKVPYELLPSEAFQRQCFVVGWYDSTTLKHACRYPGADNILWSVKMPMATSTWPETRTFCQSRFAYMPEDVRNKILWSNAASLYQL